MRPKLPLRVAVVGLLLTATFSPAAAQSEYHWSDQFGNKSTLLNGTVIGGVSDLGAVYYNPGRLARLLRPGFLLTAEAFEVNHVSVKIGQGDREQMEQASFRGIPSLVAGMFTLPSLPGHRFAYSFLTRRRFDSNLFLTAEERGDFLPESPGEETYVSTWEAESKLDENWVGLSWAHEVSPRLSVGISTFGTYLGRRRRADLNGTMLTSTQEASIHSRLREYRFQSFGLLWKAGLAVEVAPFRIGLSITTPEITAFGTSSIRYEDRLIPPRSPGGNPLGAEVLVFQEKGLEVTTHSPFAVGAGISWIRPRAELHLSGEWFSGVAEYRITGADSIASQSSGDLSEYEVVDELKSVINLGAGIELQVSQAFSAYGSIIRDASAAPKNLYRPFAFESRVSNSISQADGFYVGAGVSFEAKWIDLTAGVSYGATRETIENPLAGQNSAVGQAIPAAGQLESTRRRWRFLLGFTIPMVEGISNGPMAR